ncbi:MAG: hypothetical protein U9R26_10350, partial [Campylobacterota bacterium]|nr:hypothetical protein [Campylobacterota bacterium]
RMISPAMMILNTNILIITSPIQYSLAGQLNIDLFCDTYKTKGVTHSQEDQELTWQGIIIS